MTYSVTGSVTGSVIKLWSDVREGTSADTSPTPSPILLVSAKDL